MEEFNSKRIIMMDEENFLVFLDKYFKKVMEINASPPEWIDEKEALAFLGLRSKTTLWSLRQSGAISFSKHKKIIMYRRSSLEAYLSKHEQKAF